MELSALDKEKLKKQKVVVIIGQTAIGKTEISLKLCEEFNGEIINCDASQMKKKLNIGTAKIDLTKTNIKHHLIDIIEPNQTFSCADFQKASRKLIEEINNDHKLPFIVGGTGLYASSCIYDYDLSAKPRQRKFEALYQDLDNNALHDLLKTLDYESSLNIHPNNRVRVIRAIESAKDGRKLSENNGKRIAIYDALVICLTTDREILYERINKRVDQMIEDGFIEECAGLMKEYNLMMFPDLGYHHMYFYLNGQYPITDVSNQIKEDTRHYAKRQMTWFKHQMDCKFVNMDYDNPEETYQIIEEMIKNFIDKK